MFITSKQRDREEGRYQTKQKQTQQKITRTGVSMLVTLAKAQGASNKGKQEEKNPCFVQESVFHHQLISNSIDIPFLCYHVPSDYMFQCVNWTK